MKEYKWAHTPEELGAMTKEGWVVHTVDIAHYLYFMERDSPYLPPGSVIHIDKEGNRVS